MCAYCGLIAARSFETHTELNKQVLGMREWNDLTCSCCSYPETASDTLGAAVGVFGAAVTQVGAMAGTECEL